MRRRILLYALGLGVLMAGCTAASHLNQLQPPAVHSSPMASIPASPNSTAPQPRGVFQRGIDIDAYTYPGQNIATAAVADVAFIKSLHANAVSISFPFFMSGPASSTVYGTSSTPTPSALATIISTAENAGLYVSVKPLLDETNLGISRVDWAPTSSPAWFGSYTQFLRPYAVAAQKAGAQEFIVGAEFSMFGSSPRWDVLDHKISKVFHGKLACADNGVRFAEAGNCGAGVTETVDAYPPIGGDLLRGWKAYDAALRPGTVETEVGIDAVDGAYRKPYQHSWPGAAIDSAVQARWFSAACDAATAEHLGGIYFWSLGLSAKPVTGPTANFQGGWAAGAGAHAISRCFGALAGGGA